MAYAGEEFRAGSQIMANAVALMKGNPSLPHRLAAPWSAGGALRFALFVAGCSSKGTPQPGLGGFARSRSPDLPACDGTFLWLRRLTSPGWSFLLALVAGFCTMLWPYAYIGVEVKQSVALILAGYLGLTDDGKASWPRVLLFALSCAVAVSVKASGTFLVPAILFLIGCYYWRYSFQQMRQLMPKLLVTVAIILVVYFSNSVLRSLFYIHTGGQV